MRFIDRFTLDDVSAKVWWPFAMVLLVLFVLTFPAEHRAVAARHRDTAAVDADLSQRVIEPNVASALAWSSITGSRSDVLAEEVHDEILVNDTRIRAVRLWSTQHFLLWSSVHEPLDSASLNETDINTAIAAKGAPTWVVTHRTPTNEPGPAAFYSYTAIGGQPLVAQFEYRDGTLTSDVRASWLGYQIAIGLGLLLALTLSLLSMREPTAKIGTGVPFFAGSVPEDLALIEVDRAVAIEQAGDRIKERLASLQHKLEVSEAARLRAEGRLQQALAALAQPGRRSVMPVPQPTPVSRVRGDRRPAGDRAGRGCASETRSYGTRPVIGRPEEEGESTEAVVETEAGCGSCSEAVGARTCRSIPARARRRNAPARAGTDRSTSGTRPRAGADHHTRTRARREGRTDRCRRAA